MTIHFLASSSFNLWAYKYSGISAVSAAAAWWPANICNIKQHLLLVSINSRDTAHWKLASFAFHCCDKHMTKATWRRTELISPYNLWSIKKGSQGLNSRQEHERQKLKRGHGGVMPFVFMACSGLLSYIAQDHLPRDGTAHSGWVLPYKPLTSKILHRVAY